MENTNFYVNKSVINFIHAKDYFPENYADKYKNLLQGHNFVTMKYGREIPNFNVIYPELDMVFSKMLGEYSSLDKKNSGTFRFTLDHVHFEDFEGLNEWRLAVALEDMDFKIYSHCSGIKSALEEYKFDFFNMEDWVLETHIKLRKNEAIFYRPWLFHSFGGGMIHYYKIITEQ